MKKIKGIIPIAAAPFTRTGLLDEDSFQNMTQYLLNAAVQGLVVWSGYGVIKHPRI